MATDYTDVLAMKAINVLEYLPKSYKGAIS